MKTCAARLTLSISRSKLTNPTERGRLYLLHDIEDPNRYPIPILSKLPINVGESILIRDDIWEVKWVQHWAKETTEYGEVEGHKFSLIDATRLGVSFIGKTTTPEKK